MDDTRLPAGAERIVELFERHARWYDAQLVLERRALTLAAALAEPLAGARVVDVGAGTGALSSALLARSPRLAELTLLDASPSMLARARRRLSAIHPTPRILIADARALPLPAASADVVVMGYLLHLLDERDRRRALAEARRVIAPQGRLVAVVHGSPRGLVGGLYRAAWRAIARLSPGAVGRGPMVDLASAVEEAGFTIDAAQRLPGVYWSEVVRAVPAASR
ncbi:MAG: class I SAM-dependent methyltransferase [Thermoleophilia bacterium]